MYDFYSREASPPSTGKFPPSPVSLEFSASAGRKDAEEDSGGKLLSPGQKNLNGPSYRAFYHNTCFPVLSSTNTPSPGDLLLVNMPFILPLPHGGSFHLYGPQAHLAEAAPLSPAADGP